MNVFFFVVLMGSVPRYPEDRAKMPSSDVIGVVILARHGDREGFYQDPLTYTASATKITALGNVRLLHLDICHLR